MSTPMRVGRFRRRHLRETEAALDGQEHDQTGIQSWKSRKNQ
ncbi:hypothetical protein [Candidatus Amarobacter glycogenicus]